MINETIKSIRELIVEESGRTNRGKYDFVITPILLVILKALEFTICENNCQATNPERKNKG